MGKDRRKKENRRQAAATPVTTNETSEPKGQREPKNREKEVVKSPDPATPAPVDTGPPPVDTAELFANLKRETDDIKALNTKKYPRRQITSNWERYDEPLPTPDYEVGLQGVDFESLLHAPMSEGGHFQFKSERSWDSNIAALSGELFSLDVDYLADGLATIPLYLQLDIPSNLLTEAQREEMDENAKYCIGHYESIKKNLSRKRDKRKGVEVMDVTTTRILDILMTKEPSPAPADESSMEKKLSTLTFDIAQPDTQDEIAKIMAEDEDSKTKTFAIEQRDAANNKVNNLKQGDSTIIENIHNSERISQLDSSGELVLHKFKPENKTKQATKTVSNAASTHMEFSNKPVNETICAGVQPPEEQDNYMSKATNEVDSSVVPPKEEITQTSSVTKVDQIAQSWEEEVSEPAVPLGQRSSRRKPRGKTQAAKSSEVQDTESCIVLEKPETQPTKNDILTEKSATPIDTHPVVEKSKPPTETRPMVKKPEAPKETHPVIEKPKTQAAETHPVTAKPKTQASKTKSVIEKPKVQAVETRPVVEKPKPRHGDDDLDFLLSLKKPVRETQVSSLPSSQVTKPTIDDDDAGGPDSSRLPLVTALKQTEDLEDWLDSMLDD